MSHASSVPSPRAADARPQQSYSGTAGDVLFDAVYGGAIGGSAIALFFLVVDVLEGHPLFTPSLVGTVLFTPASPASVTEVRLDMVAYFSIVHFLAFGALGAGIAQLCRRFELVEGHPAIVAGVVFAVLTLAFLFADYTVMPGVATVIGLGLVLAANAVTGIAMAAFIKSSHRT